MYNSIYSQRALNIYTFAFVHEHVEAYKEQKIKDLLCAMWLKVLNENTNNDIECLKKIILNTENVEEFDALLYEDSTINAKYTLLPIHEQLKVEDIKQQYEAALVAMKDEFAEIDVAELEKFINTIESVDELYEKISDKEMSVAELQQIDDHVEEKLDYLAIYLPKQKIDLYRTYFNAKNEELDSSLARYAASLLDEYKGEMKFSELMQVDFIKDKLADAKSVVNFDNIRLTDEEQKNIKKYAGINTLIFLIILAIVGTPFVNYLNVFLENRLNTYILPLSILFIVFIVVAYRLIRCLALLLKNTKNVKGLIGFVADMDSAGKKGTRYRIYLPKYNQKGSVLHRNVLGNKGVLPLMKALRIGTTVKFIRILGFKFVIPSNLEEDNI